MLLTIHDMNLRQVASVDNDKQGTLNYFNDLWTRYLEMGSSTFDFTVFKKAIKSDTGSKKAYNYLNEKSFISFEYERETHLFTVRKVVENEKLIKCNCVNLNSELINEYANPYKAPKAMTFREYCQAMDLLNFTMLTIGLNEISDKKITTEWEGSDTKLARLLSLASKFGAELEFKTFLNDDSSIKQFVVNVYQGADGVHQGMGKLQPKPLRYGKDFKSLTRTVDKTEIYNMIRPTGRTEDGETVTISGLGAWSVKNENGELEFYQRGEGLYAPISMQMYPAAFTSSTMNDQWIRKDMTVESSSPEVIRATAYRELKKYAYPAVTYEVEGFTELGIGDTVQVYDDGFSPVLLLEMRVSEQAISFTNKSNNKTVFSNFKALENKLSQGIQARLDQMLEEAKPYVIKLATDNGVIFKNQTGQTVITPTLYKGGKVISNDVSWRWALDGNMTTGMNYLFKGSSVVDTVTLTVAAYVGNAEVAVDEISLVNVCDGERGPTGPQGPTGPKGAIDTEQLEEIKNDIASKADSQLTQEQLNALNEQNNRIQANMEALAAAEALTELEEAYKKYVEANDEAKRVSETELSSLKERTAEHVTKLAEFAGDWEFMTTKLRIAEEGIYFGKLDGSSEVKITDDRISFWSSKKEVMWITAGTLNIDNGIFTVSVQIGRFMEEQYTTNKDINVIRYVG